MDSITRAKRRSAVRKNQRKEDLRLERQAAEKRLPEIREQIFQGLSTQRKAPSPLDLSPVDQAFLLSLDRAYRARWKIQEEMLTGRSQDIEASRRDQEDFQREYPELVAPVPPARLADLVREIEEGADQQAADAFFSPPVKVLQTFDPFDADDAPATLPMKKITIVEDGKEREVEGPDRDNKAYPRVVYPEGSKTFFRPQDLLQGRFLRVQIDLAAQKGTILAQIKAVVDAAREVVERGETRQKDLGMEGRGAIRASLRLKTNSPRAIAAEICPDLYRRKTRKNLKDRRNLEGRVSRTLKAARAMNISV